MSEDQTTQISVEERTERLLASSAKPLELPKEMQDAWDELSFQDEVAVPKGAFLTLFAAIQSIPALTLDTCNVALSLSQGSQAEAMDAFEKLAKKGLDLHAALETTKTAIIAHTVRSR